MILQMYPYTLIRLILSGDYMNDIYLPVLVAVGMTGNILSFLLRLELKRRS